MKMLQTIACALLFGTAVFATVSPVDADPSTSAAPVDIPRGQPLTSRNAFALGYDLEYSRLRAFEFVENVKGLRDDDQATADKLIDKLAAEGLVVRRVESASFRKAGDLITALQGPKKAIDWTQKTADSLNKAISNAPAGIVSEELVSENLGSTVDETGKVQKDLTDVLEYLLPDLRKKIGPAATWAFDAGSYDAKASLWHGDAEDIPMLRREARILVTGEPTGTPTDVDAALRAVVADEDNLPTLQKGSGNLSSLLPADSNTQSAAGIRALPSILNNDFEANGLVQDLVDVEVKSK